MEEKQLDTNEKTDLATEFKQLLESGATLEDSARVEFLNRILSSQ